MEAVLWDQTLEGYPGRGDMLFCDDKITSSFLALGVQMGIDDTELQRQGGMPKCLCR